MGWRKLHLNSELWLYRITKSNIVIRSPDGKTSRVDHTDLLGVTWDYLERAEWKGYWPEIKPSMVKGYIEDHHVDLL